MIILVVTVVRPVPQYSIDGVMMQIQAKEAATLSKRVIPDGEMTNQHDARQLQPRMACHDCTPAIPQMQIQSADPKAFIEILIGLMGACLTRV
jgi:hypothetical protein